MQYQKILLIQIVTLVIFSTIRTSHSVLFCPNEAIQYIGQDVKCEIHTYEGRPQVFSVSCLEPIIPGTKVLIDCKFNYKFSESVQPNSQVICQENGEWDKEPSQCEDDCDSNNEVERIKELLWLIGIYDTNGDIENDFPVCVGVLLNAKLILSHAECLKKYNKTDLIAIAGRYQTRNVNYFRSEFQSSKIKNIYTNDNYSSGFGTYKNTRLAIIELESYFTYSAYVRQACIDRDKLNDKWQYLDEIRLSAEWWERYYLINVTSQNPLRRYEIKNVEDIKDSDLMRNAQGYPHDTFRLIYESDLNYYDLSFSEPRGFGIFIKKKTEANKMRLFAISHHSEMFPKRAGGIRYVKSFIDLLPQKDFIDHYLEQFKYNKLSDQAKEYLRKPCILNYWENVFRTSEVTCHVGNRVIPCQQQTKSGTIVRSKCNFGYTRSTDGGLKEKTCLPGGEWSNELVGCTKVCGEIAPPSSIGLVFGGDVTDISNVPWHVGIYTNNTFKSKGKFIQYCSGTIIHSNIIISAAHCFWDSSYNRPNDITEYVVAAGKNYRNFDASERQRVQYSNIQKLIIPNTYNELFYRHDIAVLLLETPFQYNSYTKPACLTLLKFGNYDLGDNVKGIVSGWGATDQFIESSDELRVIEILTMTNENCKNRVRNSRDEITGEKFCAKGKEGETACRGDSGGGFLVSQIDEDGIRRFYLWGVVSSGLYITRDCTNDFFTTYTNVQYHQDVIDAAISDNSQL